VWHLPHRHVPASEAYQARAGEDSLPLRGDPGRNESIVLAPDEQRVGMNGCELDAQVSMGSEPSPAHETERACAHSVADDPR